MAGLPMQSNPMTQQPAQGSAMGAIGGYTAQGPAGPIAGMATTIGANAPAGAGATRSGGFAQPGGMTPSKPLIQGMDTTLGAGMPSGTYSYLFSNGMGGLPGFADGGMPGAIPPPTPEMQGQPQQPQPQMQPPMGGEAQAPMPMEGQQQNAPMGGAQGPSPQDPRMMSMQLEQVIQQNPAVADQLMQSAMQIGITPQNAEQVGKIAMLAMQRPELYPQIRQYCIQQFGLDDADMPPQFDPQFMSTLAVLAHVGSGGAGLSAPPPPDASGQQSMIPQQTPAPGQEPQAQDLQQGGAISGPGSGTSDSITAKVSNGEFVVPADVVKAKGMDYFNKLVEQYHTKVGRV